MPSSRSPKAPVPRAPEEAVAVPEKPFDARRAKSEATRARILAAARELFVSESLSGTRMEHIAERAGVNKRMVYHHFGSREELFLVVLEDSYAAMREAEQALRLDVLPPLDAIVQLVKFTWDYFLKHPEFLALVTQENLHRGTHIARSERFIGMSASLLSMIRDLLGRGVKSGACRPDIDPVQLWISIAALSWFYIANTHTISATFRKDMLRGPHRAERLKHMTDLVLAYVAVPK